MEKRKVLWTGGAEVRAGWDREDYCSKAPCMGNTVVGCLNCMWGSLNEGEFLEWRDAERVEECGMIAEPTFDNVEKVLHYQLFPENNIDSRDVIERSLDLNHLKGSEAYHIGCALKYLLRCGRKGKKTEDIRKAHNYLGYLLNEEA